MRDGPRSGCSRAACARTPPVITGRTRAQIVGGHRAQYTTDGPRCPLRISLSEAVQPFTRARRWKPAKFAVSIRCRGRRTARLISARRWPPRRAGPRWVHPLADAARALTRRTDDRIGDDVEIPAAYHGASGASCQFAGSAMRPGDPGEHADASADQFTAESKPGSSLRSPV